MVRLKEELASNMWKIKIQGKLIIVCIDDGEVKVTFLALVKTFLSNVTVMMPRMYMLSMISVFILSMVHSQQLVLMVLLVSGIKTQSNA